MDRFLKLTHVVCVETNAGVSNLPGGLYCKVSSIEGFQIAEGAGDRWDEAVVRAFARMVEES